MITRGIHRDGSGQALVEFALVLPIVLLVIFGILQVALVLNARQTVAYAARVAADTYARTLDPASADTAAAKAGSQLRPQLRAPVATVSYAVTQEETQTCVRTERRRFFGRSRSRCLQYVPTRTTSDRPATQSAPGKNGDLVVARVTYRYPSPIRAAFGPFRFPAEFAMTEEGVARIEVLPPVARSTASPSLVLKNGKISFVSFRDGNGEIYVMNPDGSGQTNLTKNAADDAGPAWSPDGRKIAFYSNRDGKYQIYVMDANGSNLRKITNDPVEASRPSWSPSGTRIAFNSRRNGSLDIFAINVDGTGEAGLATTPGVQETFPAWAPDNSKILYNRHTSSADQDLFTMNTDGSGQALLLSHTALGRQLQVPKWSPDAQKIAFQGDQSGVGIQVFTMNRDATGVTQLTTPENGQHNTFPAFAPDGSKIVFTSDRDGNNEIYVMKADGSGQTRLTTNPAFDVQPAWQTVAAGHGGAK